MITTAAQIANPDYTPQNYHLYLVYLLLLILDGLLVMTPTKVIARVNAFGALFNCALVFIFIIWMPVGSINRPLNSNSQVWTSAGITNGTEWPTGFAFLMGFLTVMVSYPEILSSYASASKMV